MVELKQCRKAVDKKLAEFNHARRRYKEEQTALEAAEARILEAEEARAIAQDVAQWVQQRVHKRIADVATRCIETVFPDDPYEFKILFEQKRGRTEARLVFERDGMEVDPMTAAGGGVVDVAAFALRLACLILSKPPLRKFLCLDEPFKFVSSEHRPAVRKLLEALAEEKGVQTLMVTHIGALQAGKVVELG